MHLVSALYLLTLHNIDKPQPVPHKFKAAQGRLTGLFIAMSRKRSRRRSCGRLRWGACASFACAEELLFSSMSKPCLRWLQQACCQHALSIDGGSRFAEIPRHSHSASCRLSMGKEVSSACDSECWAVSRLPLLNEEKHFVVAQLRDTALGSQGRVASGWVCAGVSRYTKRSCP